MRADAALALKQRITASFSNAAPDYDAHAGLQRDVADALLRALPLDALPKQLADVGCGTGHVTRGLRERYPGAAITGVDPAPGMLAEAARRHGHEQLYWQPGDAEHLPFERGTLDMVTSSLAIQWCTSPTGFLKEAGRVLRPGGWLAFTTLLEGSLIELKRAFAALDDRSRINTFITQAALFEHLRKSRLIPHTCHCTTFQAFHDSAAASLRALKAVGATTLDRPARSGLMGRRHWAHVAQALERGRTPEGLPTTYQVALVVMQKPDDVFHDQPNP